MSEIIIDGIDVSGCGYIINKDSNNPICSEIGHLCKGYNNCYYKQLQRAKAENECLKEKLQISQNSDKETLRILKENVRLKNKLEEIKQFCSCYSENDIAKPIFEVILNIIDGYSEPIPDDEIPF